MIFISYHHCIIILTTLWKNNMSQHCSFSAFCDLLIDGKCLILILWQTHSITWSWIAEKKMAMGNILR